MSELLEASGPLIKEMVSALLDVLPEDWYAARLLVRRRPTTGEVPIDEHIIESEDGPQRVPVTERLATATAAFRDLYDRHGRPWDWIFVKVRWSDEQQKWNYRVEYHFPAGST